MPRHLMLLGQKGGAKTVVFCPPLKSLQEILKMIILEHFFGLFAHPRPVFLILGDLSTPAAKNDVFFEDETKLFHSQCIS